MSRTRLSLIFRYLYLLFVIGLILYYWDSHISTIQISLNGTLVAAVLLAGLALLGSTLAWHFLVRRFAVGASFKTVLFANGYSIMTKYIPGALWNHLTRITVLSSMSNNGQSMRPKIALSSILNHGASLAYGFVIIIGLQVFFPNAYMASIYTYTLIASICIIVLLGLLTRVNKYKSHLCDQFIMVIKSAHLYLAIWALHIGSFLVILYGFDCHIISNFDYGWIALYPISRLAGFIVFIAPGGIGVREIALYQLLSTSGFSEVIALSVPIYLRAANMASELFFLGFAIKFRNFLLTNRDNEGIN